MEIALSSTHQDAASTNILYRHQITTYWLWMMVITNLMFALLLLISLLFSIRVTPGLVIIALAAFSVALGAFELLRWKKRGLYLIAVGLVIHLVLNILSGDPNLIQRGLAAFVTSFGLLFIVLQIGIEQKPWNQLR